MCVQTDVKPGNRTKPKHVYQLDECVIREITANKPYAFCVHENSKNDMMVFAAKDQRQMEQWIKVLTRNQQAQTIADSIPEGDENEFDLDVSNEIEDPAPSTENMSKRDLAVLYFEEYDISTQLVSVVRVLKTIY